MCLTGAQSRKALSERTITVRKLGSDSCDETVFVVGIGLNGSIQKA